MGKAEAVKRVCVAIAAGAVVMFPAAVLAQRSTAPATGAPVAYPARGQTPQTQQNDEGECYTRAKQQSGYDPMATAQQDTASSGTGAGTDTSGGAAKGGANGAGAGAAMGAAAGDAAAQQLSATTSEKLASYDKTFSACMEDRGYTVK